MKVRIKTETGSIYILDNIGMTWERVEQTENSGKLRTDSGQLLGWPALQIGQPAILLGPPLPDWASARIIMTTPVVEMHAELDANDVPDFTDHAFLDPLCQAATA